MQRGISTGTSIKLIIRVNSMQKAKHILRDGYKFWVGDGQA